MNNNRPFVPSFLQKFDNNLLLHKPNIWSVRTHLVLYFVALIAAIVSIFCVLVLHDARADNSVAVITGFVIVIAIIGFIIWFYYLLRFNVFKRFGKWHSGDGIVTFLLLFVSVLALTFLPFIPSITQSTIANITYTSQELVNDVNEINSTVNLLEYDRLPKKWDADTFYVFKRTYIVNENVKDTTWKYNVPQDNVDKANSYNVSDNDMVDKLFYADSSLKINDTNYIIYKAPQYAYISTYRFVEAKTSNILNNKELYYAVIKNYTKPNREVLLTRMAYFKSKYYLSSNDYSYNDNYESNYKNIINKTYFLETIDRGINNVAEVQSWFFKDRFWLINTLFYITLIFTLLVFIYRHSTAKTFFLTLLSGVVLTILTALFMVISGGSEDGVFVAMFFYYVLFGLIACTIFTSTTRTVWQGISLNLVCFFMPILPLLCVGFYFECIYDYDPFNKNYIDETKYYLIAEVIGFVLLLVLIEPFFKKLYRKWYALPEA